jgi:hypothetical protein
LRWSGALVLAVTTVLVLTSCGGGGSGQGSAHTSHSGLVAELSDAKVDVKDKTVTASVHVGVGGLPGRRLTLKWGLVDAISGVRASQDERLIRRYVTTANVQEHDATIRFPFPSEATDYLIHFVLYAPSGAYLASLDTADFGPGES